MKLPQQINTLTVLLVIVLAINIWMAYNFYRFAVLEATRWDSALPEN
jgi:hypothetical protein